MMPSTTAELRKANLSRAVRMVHTAQGDLTRAELGRRLGCARGTLGTLVADLDAMGLVTETVAPATGRRGRPSACLVPAPEGPVVVALEIATDCFRLASVTLGGHLLAIEQRPFRQPQVNRVLAAARSALEQRFRLLGSRCAGVGIAVHGLVDQSTSIVSSAAGLGWVDVDVIGQLGLPPDRLTRIDNIATLSALAEAVRGRSRQCGTVLYLHSAVGVGGALTLNGAPLRGRRGFAGEYGHLPFGRQNLGCRCGVRGCWETEVDQLALARAAGLEATPATAATIAAGILTRAARGESLARTAVDQVASALGRGLGALVNVHDPDLLVLSGHAADLQAIAPEVVEAALGATALPGHRPALPALAASALGLQGALIGAAESVFDQLIDELTGLARPAGPTGPAELIYATGR